MRQVYENGQLRDMSPEEEAELQAEERELNRKKTLEQQKKQAEREARMSGVKKLRTLGLADEEIKCLMDAPEDVLADSRL